MSAPLRGFELTEAPDNGVGKALVERCDMIRTASRSPGGRVSAEGRQRIRVATARINSMFIRVAGALPFQA
jgi:hypothetical protein